MSVVQTMKATFDKKLHDLMQDKESRSVLMNEKHYKELVAETVEAKERKQNGLSLSAKQYRRLKRFDLLHDKLIQKPKTSKSKITHYCSASEMFDVLHSTHLAIGHKKEKKMEVELKKKYCNITREAIKAYLELCELCAAKKKAKSTAKLIAGINEEFNTNIHEKVEFMGVEENAQMEDIRQDNSSSPQTTKRTLEITPISLAAINRPLKKIKKLKTMLPSEMQNSTIPSISEMTASISVPNTSSIPIIPGNRRGEDVYDQFGKYIACELRALPPRESIIVRQEIQNVITRFHLALCQPPTTNNFEFNHQPMPIDYVSPTYSHSSESDSADNSNAP